MVAVGRCISHEHEDCEMTNHDWQLIDTSVSVKEMLEFVFERTDRAFLFHFYCTAKTCVCASAPKANSSL